MTRILLALVLLVSAASAQAAVRIKDIADIKGLRENQIVGYGLVIGLNGTCLLYTSPSPRDGLLSRMPSSA